MFDGETFTLFSATNAGSNQGHDEIGSNSYCVPDDPLEPIYDLDDIFDDSSEDSLPLSKAGKMQYIPWRNACGIIGFYDFRNGGSSRSAMQLCSWGKEQQQEDTIKPVRIPSEDILSDVLDELDDITQDLLPDEIAALSAAVPAIPTSTPSTPAPGPRRFKHLQPLSKPKRRVVSDDSTSDEEGRVQKRQFKRQKIATPTEESDESSGIKFRMYQAEKWHSKFRELVEYKKVYGHCKVPHGYKANATLARWAKRQRYQYKLYQENKPSTMTEDRVSALEELGFVWDSHTALWDERYRELQEFVREKGHANVPSSYPPNPKLAIWVKCQRRQYKLLVSGQASNMTYPRVELLKKLDFIWEIRKTGYLP